MKHILLVEDYYPDVRLVQRAFKKANADVTITHVVDGVDAMEFLTKQGRYTHAKTPDYILLDLNMPRKDGRAVLTELRESEEIGNIPVIVMTTSNQDHDVREAYRLGANAYLTKPPSYEDFQQVVNNIDTFWNRTALLPRA